MLSVEGKCHTAVLWTLPGCEHGDVHTRLDGIMEGQASTGCFVEQAHCYDPLVSDSLVLRLAYETCQASVLNFK